MAMTTHRSESVGREIQKEIGKILDTEIDDPLIGFVTITGVDVSADLKHADVYFSALGAPDAMENAFEGLKRACKFVRHLIAERLGLRYVPEIHFRPDPTPESAQRIEELLRAEAADLKAREHRLEAGAERGEAGNGEGTASSGSECGGGD